MFLIQLIISLLFSSFPFLVSNTPNEFCILPFAQQHCINNTIVKSLRCRLYLFSAYRQSACVIQREHQLMILTQSFAVFYPPYIDILANIMNQESTIYGFEYKDEEVALDLDLYPFVNRIRSDDFTLIIIITSEVKKLNLIVNSPVDLDSTMVNLVPGTFLITLTISSKENPTKPQLIIKNDRLCYHFWFNSANNSQSIDENYIHCPAQTCLTNQTETRICLGTIPCSHTGVDSLLCQIDRLRSTDQFNSRKSFQYEYLIITTSDTNKQTLHTFSTHLLNSCITRRLVIVVLYGRLKIPLVNLTSFQCLDGSIMKVDFWHGNCSTFEMLANHDLERMYQTNLITLSNFYTGQLDKVKIACAIYPLTTSKKSNHSEIFTPVWITLLIIIIIIFILSIFLSVLCYCKKSFRRYFIQHWRNLTIDRKIITSPPKSSSNSDLSTNTKG